LGLNPDKAIGNVMKGEFHTTDLCWSRFDKMAEKMDWHYSVTLLFLA